MVRRSFRIGLRLGLLVGVGIAVMKTVRSRRSHSESTIAAPATWEPIRDDPPAHQATLDAPTSQPRDEVGEPILEPTPSEETLLDVGVMPAGDIAATDPTPTAPPAKQPAEKSPAKKAPAKKATKKAAPVEKAAPAGKAAPVEKTAPVETAPAKRAAPAKKAAKKAAAASTAKASAPAVWVAAEGGVCPPTHPVKAKLISQIFRLPGMANYDRMRADRCYRDAASAEADGLSEATR